MGLAGKVALVTGAAQGLGRAVALRLAAEGAQVVLNDLEDGPKLRELADETGGVIAVADVSDRAAVRAMIERVEGQVGDVELLISNAAHMEMSPFPPTDPDGWWRQIDVNLSGTFHLVQAALPGLRRLGGGRIVIVSSYWGISGWPEATGYSASKAGLISLGRSLGRELAPEGILTNVVAPGVMDTPQLEVDAEAAGVPLDEIRARYAAGIPLGRLGRVEEVAATVVFLCSRGAGAFVGQVIQPNGGELRCQS